MNNFASNYKGLITTEPQWPVNEKVFKTLIKHMHRFRGEWGIYCYIHTQGEKSTIMGKDFTMASFDLDEITEFSGYRKSKIYCALKNLLKWKVLRKMTIEDADGTHKYLCSTGDIDLEELKKSLGGGCGCGKNSTEKRGNDSTPAESIPLLLAKSNTGKAIPILKTPPPKEKSTYNTEGIINLKNGRTVENIRNEKNIRRNKNIPKDKNILIGKEREGFYSKNFTEESTHDKQEHRRVLNHFMYWVYQLHKIDWYIPKTKIGRYYKQSKDLLEFFGGIENAISFVDWYVRANQFKNSGYSLDLMMSTAVWNQYNAANPRQTKRGLAKGFVDETVDKRNLKGEII